MTPVIRATPEMASRVSLAERRHAGAALACHKGRSSSCCCVLSLPAFMLLSRLGSCMIWCLLLRSRLGRNHSQADCREYGLGAALDAELGKNMTHMVFDGFLNEMQGAGDLFIRLPLREQAEDVHFTGGQGFRTFWHTDGTQEIGRGSGREVHLPGGGSFDGCAECSGLGILEQVANGPSPNRLDHRGTLEDAG